MEQALQSLRIKNKTLLLEPTSDPFENDGVLNPACMQVGNQVHMFYRAVRKGNYSSIGYCLLDTPTTVAERYNKPLLYPEHDYESQGMEDARITKIEDTFYLTYSAYDRVNVLGAMAVSNDLKTFEKKGVITPLITYREYKHFIECCPDLPEKYLLHYRFLKDHGMGELMGSKLLLWDKNLMFFPRKINGQFALLHRIHPGIQLVMFDKFEDLTKEFWEHYLMNLDDHIVMNPQFAHETSHIGGGAPPIETPHGWLFIYHSVEASPTGLIYHACAALLDLDNPLHVKGRLQSPIISPEESWELEGVVNKVVFPTGTALVGNDLYIYYGAADRVIGVAQMDFDELLTELLENQTPSFKVPV